MPRYKARVLVHLRPSVLDPAGEATRAAAAGLLPKPPGADIRSSFCQIEAPADPSQRNLLSGKKFSRPLQHLYYNF